MPTNGEGNTSHDAASSTGARSEIEYRQYCGAIWAFLPSLGDDAQGVLAFRPIPWSGTYGHFKHDPQSPRIDRPKDAASETLLATCIYLANNKPAPWHAGKVREEGGQFDACTPLPWFAGFHCPEVIVGGPNLRVIANLSTDLPEAEVRANSKLIEYAPEFLRQREELRVELDVAKRERDEARAELVKLEAAHKELKIERDQACFERDELHKAVNRCSKDIALSYSLQRQTTSERDEARKQLDIIKAERDKLAKVLQVIVSQWDSPNFLAKMILVVEDARTLLSRLNKQGGAS